MAVMFDTLKYVKRLTNAQVKQADVYAEALSEALGDNLYTKPEVDGVMESFGIDIDKRFIAFERKMDKRFLEFEQRMDKRFVELEQRMDKRFKQVDERFKQIDERFKLIDERFERLEGRVYNLELAVRDLSNKIDKVYIKSTLTTITVLGSLITIFGLFSMTH